MSRYEYHPPAVLSPAQMDVTRTVLRFAIVKVSWGIPHFHMTLADLLGVGVVSVGVGENL